MLIVELLATPQAVKALSTEELGFYVLEYLNANAAASTQYGAYKVHVKNFLCEANDAYRDDDAADAFSAAWRWLGEKDYIAESPTSPDAGWYRLTTKGRTVKSHEAWQEVAVDHDVSSARSPNFGPVVADAALCMHLKVLWGEADLAYKGGAYLATVVMLGSLLEGVLLGKAQGNQARAQTATTAPKDGTSSVRQLDKWRLVNLIEVAAEVGWIHRTRGDFSDILRDYRNLVHPQKAATTGYNIDKGAAGIAWKVVVETLRDLGLSV